MINITIEAKLKKEELEIEHKFAKKPWQHQEVSNQVYDIKKKAECGRCPSAVFDHAR